MSLPDYEAWALFAAVADHGSFRAAAAASGLSVPTVSKAVARLEARLGLALFHRTSRRVALTAAGQGLAERARAIVASAEAAEEAARSDAGDISGPIRMTAPMSLGIACLGEPLARFLTEYPQVTVDLVLSDAQCDLVGEGIDLALRIAEMEDSSLLSQTIAPVRMLLVAAPEWVARHGMPAHPGDLALHRLLGYGHGRRTAPLRLAGPDGAKARLDPTGPLFVNNGEMMLPLLRAGAGVAMLPLFIVAQDLADGRLVELLPGWQGPAATLNLVSPPSRLKPRRVAALSAHLLRDLRANPLLSPIAPGGESLIATAPK